MSTPSRSADDTLAGASYNLYKSLDAAVQDAVDPRWEQLRLAEAPDRTYSSRFSAHSDPVDKYEVLYQSLGNCADAAESIFDRTVGSSQKRSVESAIKRVSKCVKDEDVQRHPYPGGQAISKVVSIMTQSLKNALKSRLPFNPTALATLIDTDLLTALDDANASQSPLATKSSAAILHDVRICVERTVRELMGDTRTWAVQNPDETVDEARRRGMARKMSVGDALRQLKGCGFEVEDDESVEKLASWADAGDAKTHSADRRVVDAQTARISGWLGGVGRT